MVEVSENFVDALIRCMNKLEVHCNVIDWLLASCSDNVSVYYYKNVQIDSTEDLEMHCEAVRYLIGDCHTHITKGQQEIYRVKSGLKSVLARDGDVDGKQHN